MKERRGEGCSGTGACLCCVVFIDAIYYSTAGFPSVQDVVEEMDKGSLSREEYPYLKDPAGSSHQSSSSLSTRPPVNPNSRPVESRRTVGKGGSTWASKGRASSEDGYSRFSLPVMRGHELRQVCVAVFLVS